MGSAFLGVLDLLTMRGFDSSRPAKLVRHQWAKGDIRNLVIHGWLDAYQSYQSRPVFDGCEYIVSFVGTEGTRARFIGVYRVLGRRDGHQVPLPPGCPYEKWQKCPYYYDLERVPGFEDLENRIVIEWGRGALAWHQRLSNKEVLELLPKGRLLPTFRDYLEFTLTHAELRYVFEHEEANREWRSRLSAVAGIYLILATTDGAQYVGSAHGASGIWGRWSAYAKDGHGGNALLKERVLSQPGYPESFTYSILQILPRTLARSEVIEWENRYKEKLGSRATGLNASEG